MKLQVGDRWLMLDTNVTPNEICEVIVEEAPNSATSIYLRTSVGWLMAQDVTTSPGVHSGWVELEKLPPSPPKGVMTFEWSELKSGSNSMGDFIEIHLNVNANGVKYSLWAKRDTPVSLSDEDVVS